MLLYAAAFFALLLFNSGSTAFLFVIDVGSTLALFVAAALAIGAARSSFGPTRTAWYLIGAAMVAWGLGEATWTFYEVVLGRETPFPSIADVGYLGYFPLMLLGFLLLSSQGNNRRRLRTFLDAIAVTFAAGALLWNVVVEPIYEVSDEAMLGKVLATAYPLGDLLLLFPLAITFYAARRGRAAYVVLTLSAGVGIVLLSDLAFALLTASDSYASGSLLDLGWVAGSLVIGYAAGLQMHWRENLSARVTPTIAPTWKQLLPLALMPPVLLGLVLAGSSSAVSREVPTTLLAALFVLMVVGRQAVTIADSVSLNRTLLQMNAELTRTHTEVEMRSTQLANLLQMEEIRARTDELTGVKNRAAMNEVLTRLAAPEHAFTSAALILVDVDGMKAINDSHGHLVGDKVLRALSSALSTGGAIVSRFGGDEFLVVLPEVDEARAEHYIRDIRRLLQLTRVLNDDGQIVPIEVSAGAAIFPQDGNSTQEVIRLADERMYETKGGCYQPHLSATFDSEGAA